MRGRMQVCVLQGPYVTHLVANSTPMVDLDSKLNSLRVNRDNRLLFPTPESPISTTVVLEARVTDGRQMGV